MAAPTPNIYAVSESVVGIAVEATRGTAVAPDLWEKLRSPAYKPDITMLEDVSLQGNMAEIQNVVLGMAYDAHQWDTHPYLDVFPAYVRANLGSTDTIGAAPTSTTLSAAATKGASTITLTAAPAAGTMLVVDTGTLQETVWVLSVAADVATLEFPLLNDHASGAAVAGLTTHAFSLLNNGSGANQPPTYTITDYDGEEWRQLTAAQNDKLEVKLTDTGLADVTVSWFANQAVAPSPTPTPSETSTVQAPPSWTTRVLWNGSVQNNWSEYTLDLARQVKPVPALQGVQEYYTYFADALTSTGSISAIETFGAPELAAYKAGTQAPITVMFTDPSTGYGCRMHSERFMFKSGSLERSKQWPTASLDFQLLPSATDATAGGGGVSPIQITVGNGTVTSY